MFATRSLKALVASVAVVIALFVAAVPAYARPGNGNNPKGQRVSQPTYGCVPDLGCGWIITINLT